MSEPCPICTYSNAAGAPVCTMCGANMHDVGSSGGGGGGGGVGGGGAMPLDALGDMWQCTICSLKNPPHSSVCAVCEVPRDAKGGHPVVAAATTAPSVASAAFASSAPPPPDVHHRACAPATDAEVCELLAVAAPHAAGGGAGQGRGGSGERVCKSSNSTSDALNPNFGVHMQRR